MGFERPEIEPSTEAKKRKFSTRAADLGLDRRERLADVARLELGELLAVRDDRVGEGVQEPRALVRRRLAPRAVEGGARRRDRAVDVGLARHRGASEHLPRRRLVDVARLARGRLDGLSVDEETVLVARRDCHVGGRYRLTGGRCFVHNGIRERRRRLS